MTAGALKACLSTDDISDDEAIEKARSSDSIVGKDYVKQVTCSESYEFDTEGEKVFPSRSQGRIFNKNPYPNRLIGLLPLTLEQRMPFSKIFAGMGLKSLSYQLRRQWKR